MENCVNEVIQHYGVDTGIKISTNSTLPVASGLSSSSATSNAIVSVASKLIAEEFELTPLNDEEIINLGINASLKSNVTITGAFDDASASYYGGLVITDNYQRKIIQKKPMEKQNILIHIPNKKVLTAQSDLNRMKLISPLIETAYQKVIDGDIYNALTLNGILYCAALDFNPNIALDALDSGALASGLSGTGLSFVTITDDKNQENVYESLKSYPGKIIITEVDNKGTR